MTRDTQQSNPPSLAHLPNPFTLFDVRDARLLAEHDAHELRVLAEDARRLGIDVVIECNHAAAELVVHRTFGGGPIGGDTYTEHGMCRGCGAWLSRTYWLASGAIEDRPLTASELDALQVVETRYRHADYLDGQS